MNVVSDLLLLTTDPATGKSLLGSTESTPVLGGAVLVDLVLAERCSVDGPPKKAKVSLLSSTPLGSPAHDQALGRIKPGRATKASTLVPKLGRGLKQRVLDGLVAERALAPRSEKVLGLFPVTRYDVVDTARRDRLATAVRAVLAGEQAPDETTGPLVGLLSAGGVVKRLVPKEQRRAAVRRAKDIADGDWAGAAVQAAVVATSSAVAAAVGASVIVAASGGAVSGS